MSKFNYFSVESISSTDFTMVNFGFNSTGIMLMVDSTDAADEILYSFDGVSVHGSLAPTKPSQAMAFDNRRECKIWLARDTAGSAVLVRVEAWG